MTSTRSYGEAAALVGCGGRRRGAAVRVLSEDAALVSLACVLGLVESWLPAPVLGVRLGLANVVVLVALVRSGWVRAARVSAAKVLLVGLAGGSLGGPAFVLSAAGALASLIAMQALLWTKRFSVAGVSLGGSFAHVAGQLVSAAALASSSVVAALATPALLASIPLGMITGMIAGALVSRLEGVGSSGR
ncbi:MAG: Gx transporter family protein [Anaerosomatales bacterium]|nr:Gx transporter family protein [Anaerosomatales bacterium]